MWLCSDAHTSTSLLIMPFVRTRAGGVGAERRDAPHPDAFQAATAHRARQKRRVLHAVAPEDFSLAKNNTGAAFDAIEHRGSSSFAAENETRARSIPTDATQRQLPRKSRPPACAAFRIDWPLLRACIWPRWYGPPSQAPSEAGGGSLPQGREQARPSMNCP
jgi:hypothetical protein